jgi:alpha-beta hydrolase superfamily lysophospholipase
MLNENLAKNGVRPLDFGLRDDAKGVAMPSEKVSIESRNGTIRGTLTAPEGSPAGVLICLHEGPGGDEHSNTGGFDQIAAMAADTGFATLQFSFYGNGDSDGAVENYCIASQLSDYEAAVAFMKQRFGCPIHVVGESAGATIAALNWRDDVSSFILLWPAFDLLDTDLRPFLQAETLEHLRENKIFERDGVRLGRQLVYDILTTNFESSFDLLKKPIFIAHGKED